MFYYKKDPVYAVLASTGRGHGKYRKRVRKKGVVLHITAGETHRALLNWALGLCHKAARNIDSE